MIVWPDQVNTENHAINWDKAAITACESDKVGQAGSQDLTGEPTAHEQTRALQLSCICDNSLLSMTTSCKEHVTLTKAAVAAGTSLTFARSCS